MSDIVFDWSEDKNNLLKKSDRKVSFEDVVFALKNEKILDIIPSPTRKEQRCFVIDINDYVYIVPYVMDKKVVFLKTIYPSRKHTKYYLKD